MDDTLHNHTKTSSNSSNDSDRKEEKKRNRKDKIGKVLLRIKRMAVQHKVAIPVNCELPRSRPPARLYRTQRRRAETYLCFFQLISLTMLSYPNHFIHSSASLATLRYAK